MSLELFGGSLGQHNNTLRESFNNFVLGGSRGRTHDHAWIVFFVVHVRLGKEENHKIQTLCYLSPIWEGHGVLPKSPSKRKTDKEDVVMFPRCEILGVPGSAGPIRTPSAGFVPDSNRLVQDESADMGSDVSKETQVQLSH